jgi:hypothetical protein
LKATDSSGGTENLRGLATKKEIASLLRLSPRSVENLVARRAIPIVRISARCVRFSPEAVLRALGRFTVEAVR